MMLASSHASILTRGANGMTGVQTLHQRFGSAISDLYDYTGAYCLPGSCPGTVLELPGVFRKEPRLLCPFRRVGLRCLEKTGNIQRYGPSAISTCLVSDKTGDALGKPGESHACIFPRIKGKCAAYRLA